MPEQALCNERYLNYYVEYNAQMLLGQVFKTKSTCWEDTSFNPTLSPYEKKQTWWFSAQDFCEWFIRWLTSIKDIWFIIEFMSCEKRVGPSVWDRTE